MAVSAPNFLYFFNWQVQQAMFVTILTSSTKPIMIVPVNTALLSERSNIIHIIISFLILVGLHKTARPKPYDLDNLVLRGIL